MTKTVCLQEMRDPLHSIFSSHGYVQQRSPEWSVFHRLRYHVCFMPSDVQLQAKKVIAFNDFLDISTALLLNGKC